MFFHHSSAFVPLHPLSVSFIFSGLLSKLANTEPPKLANVGPPNLVNAVPPNLAKCAELGGWQEVNTKKDSEKDMALKQEIACSFLADYAEFGLR